jgi:hypothetical protein
MEKVALIAFWTSLVTKQTYIKKLARIMIVQIYTRIQHWEVENG